jgi:uncharacterized oligopeptide transporter (OPT) family protein
MMSGGSAPWLLYGIGALIALALTALKVPALPFALGMFIPIDLNMPMLVGGAISWFVSNRSKDKELNEARMEKGTLIASGFIAGGALMGVVSASLQFFKINLTIPGWGETTGAEWLSLGMYLVLIGYLTKASMSVKQ